MSLDLLIRATLRANASLEAIVFGNEIWLWREVSSLVDRLDTALSRAGLGPGTRIGLVARNRPAQVAAFAGLLGTRRCVVMIYAAQSPDGIARDIAHLGLRCVLADAQDWTTPAIAAARVAGSMGFALHQNPAEPLAAVSSLEGPGVSAEPAAPSAPSTDRSEISADVVMELLSSGTTGAPKRIALQRRSFEAAVEDAALVYGLASEVQRSQVMFQPLSNIAGVTFLIPFLFQAHKLVLLEKFALAPWLTAIALHRPSRTSLPPAALRMILDAAVPQHEIASLTAIGVGGAKLDPALQREFEQAYGIPLLTAYGATEFCGVVANWTPALRQEFGDAKSGSAGRARPGVAFKIVDPQTDAELPHGEIGVLTALVPRAGPDWIRTTDIASLDADGFLFLHGRADGAINRGGFKILPETIASVLRNHPSVADAAVLGLPDARLGSVPIAAVEPRPGASPSEASLMAYAKANLLTYQVPIRIFVLPDLPRNPSMKVDQQELTAIIGGLI